jgi:hypothetical protein
MDITVILPIHEINEEVEKYVGNAVTSIRDQIKIDEKPKLLVVCPESIISQVKDLVIPKSGDVDVNVIANDGNSKFQAQVNHAVKQVDTNYFSILELDDEYSNTYFYHANLHTQRFNDVDLFLSMIVETTDNDKILQFTNVSIWSRDFVGQNGTMGYLNMNALNEYTDFKTSGAIFKKSTYEEYGGFKTNIDLTFNYEFLLRLLHQGAKIYTIPRLGYKHVATRKGSMFMNYSVTMSVPERKFWFDVAKREAPFLTDREIDKTSMNVS